MTKLSMAEHGRKGGQVADAQQSGNHFVCSRWWFQNPCSGHWIFVARLQFELSNEYRDTSHYPIPRNAFPARQIRHDT